MRQPNYRSSQTVITLTSLVVTLSKLIHVNDQGAFHVLYSNCGAVSLSETTESQERLHKLDVVFIVL